MIVDINNIKQLIKPNKVILVRVNETCEQIDLLKQDLKEISNAKIIIENGRNHKLLETIKANGQTPVLLLGKSSEQSMTRNVKYMITDVVRSCDYLTQEARDIFIF